MIYLWGALLFLHIIASQVLGAKLILYTDNDSYGRKGETKVWYIALGEPAFGSFSDLKAPTQFYILTPKGEKERLPLLRREFFDPWFNQKRIGYETRVSPGENGDYILCFEGDEILTLRGTLQKPSAKAYFHVGESRAWDRLCGFELEIKPLTRPYGLRAGALFWGQVLYYGEPLSEAEVEVERLRKKLNPFALPKDSTGEINIPLMKKTTKLDERGYFVVNFEEEGWWSISVRIPRGVKIYGNQQFNYELQTSLWIYVFDPSSSSPKRRKFQRSNR